MTAHVLGCHPGSPRAFRRTYFTFLVAAGYEIPYIQAQVGHGDPTTTLEIYAQVLRRADPRAPSMTTRRESA